MLINILFRTLANLGNYFIKNFCSQRLWVYSKNIVLNFSLFKTIFIFWFSLYKMVDIIDIHMSLNISIGTVMESPEMLTLLIILKLKKSVSMQLTNYLIY